MELRNRVGNTYIAENELGALRLRILREYRHRFAAVIMFGLGFATILTLIVVPVLYTLAYRMNPPRV